MTGDVPSTVPVDPARPGGPPPRLALYRRYRPATFTEVKGQDHVTEPLRQALRTGRVNHAYLFSGPRGCGKTTSARILARSLNCAEGPTPDPCGKCESCVALAPDGPGSLDVIEIDAASHGGVDDARDLRERAFYAPVSGRFKIYIIDEAHMVTREGFNALLKLVEEPPPHLKFVFATTEPEKVIATIRSRTHHYPFRLVPPAILRELLEEILSAEQIAYEPAVLPLVVRAGAGSARDSLSVLDQLLAGAGEEGLRYDRTVALLGYTDENLLDEVADAFANEDGAAVFRSVNRVMEGGHDPRRFAADLLDRFRDLIVLAAVPGAGQTGLLDMPADRLDRMTEQAGRFGQAELTRAAEIISEGLIQMRGATSPRLLLELMCAQILLPAASSGEKALLVRLERLERRLEGGQAGSSGSGVADTVSGRVSAGPVSAGPVRAGSGQAAPAASSAPAARSASAASSAPAATSASATAGAASGAPAAQSGPQAGASAASRPGPGASSRSGTPTSPPATSSGPAASATPHAPPGADVPGAPAPGTSAPVASRDGVSAPSPASVAPAPASPGNASPGNASPGNASPGNAAPATPAGHPATGASSGVDVVRQRWPEILEAVKGKRRVAWMLLSNATVHSVDGGVLTVLFAREGEAKGFSASGYDRDLITVLTSILGLNLRIKSMSAAQLASTPGAPRSPHGGPDELSAKAPAAVHMPPEPPADPEPPHTLSAEAQYDSAPVQRVSEDLSGMDLIKRELGGRIIAEIDEP
ncbi:MAG: DNA polymerase III subunit gamma and tau [Streptosporangiaceae bacterium]